MNKVLLDKRLSYRCTQLQEQLNKPVGQSIPQVTCSPYEAKASYRFLG
jgi:hypothetical protein